MAMQQARNAQFALILVAAGATLGSLLCTARLRADDEVLPYSLCYLTNCTAQWSESCAGTYTCSLSSEGETCGPTTIREFTGALTCEFSDATCNQRQYFQVICFRRYACRCLKNEADELECRKGELGYTYGSHPCTL